jgi:GntR family transcriptional regulator
MAAAKAKAEPAYRRIQRLLQNDIAHGRMTAGEVLPSERELAKAHGVSLMTARQALHGLELQGVVERRRGSGTFVAPLSVRYNKLLSTTELMSSRGLAVESKILYADAVPPQPEIAARLGIPAQTPLLKLERLRQVGSEPLALETNLLPAAEYRDLGQAVSKTGSLFTALQQNYGIEIAYSDEDIDATPADPRTAELLSIPGGAPVLRIRQLFYTKTGRPFMHCLAHYRSDRHTLFVRRFRS